MMRNMRISWSLQIHQLITSINLIHRVGRKQTYIENGHIKGIDFIKENYEKIKDKNVIVFYVGLGLYNMEEIIKLNFIPTYRYKRIKFFELLGDFDYKKLNFMDKMKVIYNNGRMSSSALDFRKKIVNSKKDNLDDILNFINFKKLKK